mmetsp:Transcript_13098/g.41435  ORF Transcript_13098/g.41435 Transcript_13098/m.41435 type:complete len:157 (+) Transcript_13098:574-1044(+)
MTSGLVKALDPDSCLEGYKDSKRVNNRPLDGLGDDTKGPLAADVALGCCVLDAGGTRMHLAGFSNVMPGIRQCHCGEDVGLSEKCSQDQDAPFRDHFTFHHVTPKIMRALYETESIAYASYGDAFKNSARPLAQPSDNLYQHTCAPAPILSPKPSS